MSRIDYYEGWVWKTNKHPKLTHEQEDKLEKIQDELNKDISYSSGARWMIIVKEDYIAVGKCEDATEACIFNFGDWGRPSSENINVVNMVEFDLRIERTYDHQMPIGEVYTREHFQMQYYNGGYHPFEDKPDWKSLFYDRLFYE